VLHGLKYAVKVVVAETLHATGLLRLWLRVVLRRRAIVLTYHRVLPLSELRSTWSQPSIVVSPETFDSHLRCVRTYLDVLSVQEFLVHLETATPFRNPSCLITFDDGWRDTFEHAWPLLKRHQVPALVFLPVDQVGRSYAFWQEQLGALLHTAWQRARGEGAVHPELSLALDKVGMTSVLSASPTEVRPTILRLVSAAKGERDTGERAVHELRQVLGDQPSPGPAPDGLVSWEAVAQMAARPAARTHIRGSPALQLLITLPPDAQTAQILAPLL